MWLQQCSHTIILAGTGVCPCRRSDYEVGEELLRKYVLIHLTEPADKLQLMLAMLHKLYALVRPGGVGGAIASVAQVWIRVWVLPVGEHVFVRPVCR